MHEQYEPPHVVALGAFDELTLDLTAKDTGEPNDGFSYRGQPLMNVS